MLNVQVDHSIRADARANGSAVELEIHWGDTAYAGHPGGLDLIVRLAPQQARDLANQLGLAAWQLSALPPGTVVHGG